MQFVYKQASHKTQNNSSILQLIPMKDENNAKAEKC